MKSLANRFALLCVLRGQIAVAEPPRPKLQMSLPESLRGSLPTIADIERELNKPSRAKPRAKSKP